MQKYRDVVAPAELALLQKVLDAHCEQAGIERGPVRDELAAQLLRAFQGGKTDEAQLAQQLAGR